MKLYFQTPDVRQMSLKDAQHFKVKTVKVLNEKRKKK